MDLTISNRGHKTRMTPKPATSLPKFRATSAGRRFSSTSGYLRLLRTRPTYMNASPQPISDHRKSLPREGGLLPGNEIN
ncbi:hypothetical protein AVEN_28050-1, partial [Araneus ventricosus]